MTQVAKKRTEFESRTVRVLGRGLRAQRGVRLTLRTLREGVGKTQAEVQRAAKIDQGDVSRLESRPTLDESLISTLQRYIEALGGKLELTAVFGDKKITIVGVEEAESARPTVEPRASPGKSRRASSPKTRAKRTRGRS